MRKMIFTIAMGVLCLCVTSCSDICEDAYVAEQMYKHYKSMDGGSAAAAQYEAEFMELYTSMSYNQRERYKAYREHMDTEARELATMEQHIKDEVRAMLSE